MIIRSPVNPDEQKITYSLGAQTEFLFDVRACEQAQIQLQEGVKNTVNYELVIGAEANMKSKVYKQGRMVHEQVHQGISLPGL